MDNTTKSGIVGAVGHLILPHTRCTATLVGRSSVVTAAHCVCLINIHGNGIIGPSGVSIKFPQWPFSFAAAKVTAHPQAKVECENAEAPLGAHDLAVVELAAPVPTTVVADLPPVFLRSADFAYQSNRLRTFVSVGFGGTVKWSSSAGADDNRRRGEVTPIWLHRDTCDVFESIFDAFCHPSAEWTGDVNSTLHAVTGKGDSGGPLFAYHKIFKRSFLIGVFSGWRWSPSKAVQFWAPTADVGKPHGDDFLRKELGGDPDGDNVAGVNDNCPDTPNFDQLDSDGDEVGDACDNCPTLYNVSQANKDGDSEGDLCDACPHVAGIDGVSIVYDKDGDGIGDICDTCDKPNPYALCTTDSECLAAGAFCIREQPPDTIPVPGRCSLPTDSDFDGFPDACDDCPFANLSQQNSNKLAEEREQESLPSLETLADDCDAVPLLRLERQQDAIFTAKEVNTTPLRFRQAVSGARWLGRETPSTPSLTRLNRIGYRYCACYDSLGMPLEPLEACVGKGLTCRWDDPEKGADWQTPKMSNLQGLPLLDGEGFTINTFNFETAQALGFTAFWEWRDDVRTGSVPGKGDCAAGALGCETHGAFFSTNRGISASFRDTQTAFRLRHTFQIAHAPSYFVGPNPDIAAPAPCEGSDCLHWIDTKLYLDDPPEFSHFGNLFSQPVVVDVTNSSASVFAESGVAFDITDKVGSTLLQALSEPGVSFLSPVEPDALIRRYPDRGDLQGIVMPRNFDGATTFRSVLLLPGGISFDPRIDMSPALLATNADEPVSPRARNGISGLLSGVEEAVFMVGGSDVETNQPSQAIWRYDLNDRSWRLICPAAEEVPAGRVLSLAYDQPKQLLYVLELDSDPLVGNKEPVRLLRFDIRAGTSQVVGRFRYTGIHAQLRIMVLADGSLAFLTGRKNRYQVYRLDVSGAEVKILGSFGGKGAILGQPAMGETHPFMAVTQKVKGKTELRYEALNSGRFTGKGKIGPL